MTNDKMNHIHAQAREEGMERGPIFIGGPDRCGKTTMRAFLVSHPNISIPAVGSNMWTYFYGQFGDLGKRANFERCLEALLHYKHVRFLKPDPDRIRQEFWQGEPSYARLFALFQEHHAEREGKPRWGDQTGLVERYADLIFAAYPQAKMIHMIRDPRDRYEASLALWPTGKMRAGGATARWLYSVGLAQRNIKRYPRKYKMVRFETLILHPEETLREICTFLNEEYSPAMLAMEGAPDHREKMQTKSGSEAENNFLSPDFIGRYRRKIPPREIAFMQMHAGRQMVAKGYPLESLRFSLREKLLFALVDWPTNLARMAGWLAIEYVQHKFPAQFGRKPSRSRVLGSKRGNSKMGTV